MGGLSESQTLAHGVMEGLVAAVAHTSAAMSSSPIKHATLVGSRSARVSLLQSLRRRRPPASLGSGRPSFAQLPQPACGSSHQHPEAVMLDQSRSFLKRGGWQQDDEEGGLFSLVVSCSRLIHLR